MKHATTLPEATNDRKGLLDKATASGLKLPWDLERLAIGRGCTYYQHELVPIENLENVVFSNAELAIALLIVSSPPQARNVRLAAAMLGASDLIPEQAAKLAVENGCSGIVRYIAAAGARFEPENPFWKRLLDLLPQVNAEFDNLPHPTRFVEMTGIERGRVGTSIRWIRPQRQARHR